ncbi:hypothetical protein BSK47_02245 [Paenibacillus odorifer]|uniref:Uncharacterized protein n=1 Tax=Paenibacillus odorifer TaxID=189426 RepID=A0AB36JL89_9BACL|nr:hypothetical protein BSK47_02245 [Paenibacillus odorifer]
MVTTEITRSILYPLVFKVNLSFQMSTQQFLVKGKMLAGVPLLLKVFELYGLLQAGNLSRNNRRKLEPVLDFLIQSKTVLLEKNGGLEPGDPVDPRTPTYGD